MFEQTMRFNPPSLLATLSAKCEEIGFTMASDGKVGSLLRTLVSSKPGARLLELGTGIGLSLCWMQDGMSDSSTLITVDNDPQLSEIAEQFFGRDPRIQIVCADGEDWIRHYAGPRFDLVFADAWPGKYSQLDEVLDLILPGGFYVIDDLLPHPDWPEGHAPKVNALIRHLEGRSDFRCCHLVWSTGVILASKAM